ncbi:hypothetical protein [Bradyrhizobium oligotrophicum]|uniref:hypothetical protein n=1 Tax=Bradyrhizobium oligotrophicum TaxID=44255 RepID=UPI003EBB251F
MLIKTVTLQLHSLSYLVGITSSVAVHQVIPTPGTAIISQSGKTALGYQQVANRSTKSDKLPIRQAKHQLNRIAPVRMPANTAPGSRFGTDCRLPIDVPGRCFAGAGADRKVALSAPAPLGGIQIALNQTGPDATDLV